MCCRSGVNREATRVTNIRHVFREALRCVPEQQAGSSCYPGLGPFAVWYPAWRLLTPITPMVFAVSTLITRSYVHLMRELREMCDIKVRDVFVSQDHRRSDMRGSYSRKVVTRTAAHVTELGEET
jgi:hypothetical protein